ncbi:MAG: Crp/Fnr family transcriptional regulator [Cyclobacteriaceae bacterium]|nr:Crp/Fnr family transcriptional regulator [Cyclobacteriaceae bacterium]
MDEFSSIRKFISQVVQFTEEEWQAQQAVSIRRWLKKGEYLLRAGQVCNHVSFINKGVFRVFNIVNDNEYTAYFAFENDYVTDYKSFLTRKPSFDNIVALEDAELIQLDYDSMQRLYETFPVWQKYGRLISEYVFIETAERTQSLLLKSPEERYLQMLKEHPQIPERIPLKYIASYIGVTPEALSRIRKRITIKPN